VKLRFRTTLFDSISHGDDESFFYGEDLARWLAARLPEWETDVQAEDWGWAIYASRPGYRYVFGVYYEGAGGCAGASGHGADWCVRLYDESWRGWRRSWRHGWRRYGWRSLLRHVFPVADPEVVDEVTRILRAEDQIHDLRVEPLD
jgi:hypothetical protein